VACGAHACPAALSLQRERDHGRLYSRVLALDRPDWPDWPDWLGTRRRLLIGPSACCVPSATVKELRPAQQHDGRLADWVPQPCSRTDAPGVASAVHACRRSLRQVLLRDGQRRCSRGVCQGIRGAAEMRQAGKTETVNMSDVGDVLPVSSAHSQPNVLSSKHVRWRGCLACCSERSG